MSASRHLTYLKSNELFKSLDDDVLSALEDDLALVILAEKDTLYEQGDAGDCLYVLGSGRLALLLRDADGTEIVIGEESEPGTIVGEMSLVTGQDRKVTIFALSDAELVRLSKKDFDQLAERNPEFLTELSRTTTQRWKRNQLARVLTSWLGDVDTNALLDLQAQLDWQELSPGDVVFRQGDVGDGAYIVVTGRLRITTTRADGSERVVDESGPGQLVGEFALLTGEVRSATVFAVRESNVVRLTPPVFARLLSRHPQVMMQITRTIIGYHRRTLRAAPSERTSSTNIALVATSQDVRLSEFARELAQSLSGFGPVLRLDSRRFDELYGRDGAAQTPLDDPTHPVLAGWMSGQEAQFHYMLYEADLEWSPWTQRCVRQADRVLLVGQSGTDPAPGPIEIAIGSQAVAARTELVMLHPAGTVRPKGTADWLACRSVGAHHHVREGQRAHYDCLARRLADRAIALVLSGGAARGFAHLGVFRALEELDIHVDRIGGTSMGALLAAGFAMGRSYDEMVELARSFASPKALFDYTLPYTSLMASRKLTNVMLALFADLCVEDLWCPYFCVSANLTRAEPVVHQTGHLWKCVRSSIAIPGVFSPILHDGEVLVDGGALNNFPVDIMRDLCKRGTVIGVNVSQTHETAETGEFGASISGWQVLGSRVNPFAEPMQVPTIGASLVRALEIKGVHQIKTLENYADLLIQPLVGHFKTLDFASYEAVSAIGYQTALHQLGEWKAQQSLAI